MIKGITDKQKVAWPILGYLYKGARRTEEDKKKNRPGAPLSYLRFEPTDPEDQDLMVAIESKFGKEPRFFNFIMPYRDLEENWQAWKEKIREASGLEHRCDGEFCTIWFDEETGEMRSVDKGDEPIPCPGGCTPVGYLHLFIPDLERVGTIILKTNSIHDIIHIQGVLEAFHGLNMKGMPFFLRRVPRIQGFPSKGQNGKMVRRKKEQWALLLQVDYLVLRSQIYQLPSSSAVEPPALEGKEIIDAETGELLSEPSEEQEASSEGQSTESPENGNDLERKATQAWIELFTEAKKRGLHPKPLPPKITIEKRREAYKTLLISMIEKQKNRFEALLDKSAALGISVTSLPQIPVSLQGLATIDQAVANLEEKIKSAESEMDALT